MSAMIEIHYTNGRKRRIPETDFIADGESIVTVLDIGLESLDEGLFLYLRHYEPQRPAKETLDVPRDPRGLPAVLYNDAFICIVPPERVADIERVYYEGRLELMRFTADGDLVNMRKVTKSQMLYMDSAAKDATRLTIAELYHIVKNVVTEKHPDWDDEAVIVAVCDEIGVTRSVLSDCVSFQSSYALGDSDYAIEHGLPFMNSDGALVRPGDDGYRVLPSAPGSLAQIETVADVSDGSVSSGKEEPAVQDESAEDPDDGDGADGSDGEEEPASIQDDGLSPEEDFSRMSPSELSLRAAGYDFG